MRVLSFVSLVLTGSALAACTGGCSGSKQHTAETEHPGSGQAALAIASSDPQSGAAAPPHRFVARRHAAKPRLVHGTVNLSELPALVNQVEQCFHQESMGIASGAVPTPRKKRASHRARSKSAPGSSADASGGLGSGGLGLGQGAGSNATSGTRPRRWAPPSPAAQKPAAEEGSLGQKAAESRVPPPTPTPPNSPPDREDDRASSSNQAPLEIAEDGRGSDAADRYHDWGSKIYLSNDDTMSLSSAQRVIWAIDHFEPLPAKHIRPHELLNYFSFDTREIPQGSDFSVSAGIQPKPGEAGIYTLGFAVAGRALSKAERRGAALTFVIDRSGSMGAEGRMSYLKRGLMRMTQELKQGDLINLVYFDHSVCSPLQNFVVGRDSMSVLKNAISRLRPRGSTDLHSGLKRGYQLADASYQTQFSNRVVMITDALTNTGVTNQEMISMISDHYDRRRIRLSGVGVGRGFNDSLLDRLTERGKGAYVFLGSEAEVDAVFGNRFVSLIETVANDVHFRLHLPPSLRMNVFYGEESSTEKADVQAIHYFAGTSQLFLSDLMARDRQLRPQDDVMLTVEYEDPETGKKLEEEYAFNLGEIAKHTRNVQKGRLVMSFVDGLKDMALSTPSRRHYRRGGWVDERAYAQCETGKSSLQTQAQGLGPDPEVDRVVALWDQYCARYEAPRHSIRRTAPRGGDVWPSAHVQ